MSDQREYAKGRILDECRQFRRNDLDEPMVISIIAKLREDFLYLDYVENEESHDREPLPYSEWYQGRDTLRREYLLENKQELSAMFGWD